MAMSFHFHRQMKRIIVMYTSYSPLNHDKMQPYLELKQMTARQAKAWFKFRVRMAPFGENFRGGKETIMCPLCSLHPDSQAASFHCSELRKFVEVRGDYMNIFSENFSSELVKTIFNIYNFRAEFRKLHGEK